MTLTDRIAAEQRAALRAAADAALIDPAASPASAAPPGAPTWDDLAEAAWIAVASDRLRADLRTRYCAGPVNRVS
jgi:hypothetical protein